MDRKLTDVIRHPLTGVALGVSAIGQFGFAAFDPAWALISSTAGLWFPIAATTGSTIFPQFGYGELGTQLLLAAAILFVAVQADRLWERLKERI